MKKVFWIIIAILIVILYSASKYNDYIVKKYGLEKDSARHKINNANNTGSSLTPTNLVRTFFFTVK